MRQPSERVHDDVRDELQERAERSLPQLELGSGDAVRFYGVRRGRRFRIARFESRREASRVAYGLRAARRRLGRWVPRVHVDWVERNVVVTELIRGRVVPRLGSSRLERCTRLLARLHNVDISRHRHLGPMRGCFADRLDRLIDSVRALGSRSRPRGLDAWRKRYQVLKRRRWPRVLTHGDPHEENFVWSEDGQPSLIDWDLSMPGAPHFDLAYLLYWRADTLCDQRRPTAWKRSVEWLLGVYNGAARRRRLALADLLQWLGVVALMYVGFGVQLRKAYYVPLAEWIWGRLDELAREHGLELDGGPAPGRRPHSPLRPPFRPRRAG